MLFCFNHSAFTLTRAWQYPTHSLLTKGFSPKATGSKAGTNFSPQAIGTKACTRLSGLGTVPISPRASGLISAFLLVICS